MHHLILLMESPIFWIFLLVFLNYHHIPVSWYSWLKYPFIWIAVGIEKLDYYIFDDPKQIKEVKKNRFKKIVSPFGEFLLAIIAIMLYGGDYIFIKPASRFVNKILESDKMKDFITFIERQDIIVLRAFVGIPFLLMEVTGSLALMVFFSNPILGGIIYITKFIWVVPFKFIDKIGHDKLSKDPWYSGLKGVVVRVLDWLFELRFMKKVKNSFTRIKNFIKDSNHNTTLEIKLRKKLISKVFGEIFSLKHLTDELSESDDIEIIVFSPEATKKLQNLKKNPNNTHLKKWIVDYIKKEIGVENEQPQTKM